MMDRSLAPLSRDPGVVSPYLLIGNELPLYREVLSDAFRIMRPAIPVRAMAPADIDAAVICLPPWIVTCSTVTATIDDLAHAWILLHPSSKQPSVISVAGEQRTIPHPTFADLVQLVDAIWKDAPTAVLEHESPAPQGDSLGSTIP